MTAATVPRHKSRLVVAGALGACIFSSVGVVFSASLVGMRRLPLASCSCSSKLLHSTSAAAPNSLPERGCCCGSLVGAACADANVGICGGAAAMLGMGRGRDRAGSTLTPSTVTKKTQSSVATGFTPFRWSHCRCWRSAGINTVPLDEYASCTGVSSKTAGEGNGCTATSSSR